VYLVLVCLRGLTQSSGQMPFPETASRFLAMCGFVLLGLICGGGRANAHVSGFTDTSIQVATTGVRVIYTVPADNLLELERWSGGERRSTPEAPGHYLPLVKAGWRVSAGGERCLLSKAEAREVATVGSYQFQFTYVCPKGLDAVSIGYDLFVDHWAEHENFVRMFMADQRSRLRFTSERRSLDVPVADLLRQWRRPLAAGFFDADPNHALQAEDDGAERALPRIVDPAPDLGGLNFAGIDPGFVRLGVRHILAGLDHVLFVAGLVLLARKGSHLLALVTAFTVAHAVTMGLATFGVLHLDPRWTEPLIAFTIVYIGVENLLALHRGVAKGDATTGRGALLRRLVLVFVFGLIHGVGFSYVLREMGLREELLGTLLYFNAGVELGQLGILAVALPAALLWRRLRWGHEISVAVSASVAVAGLAMLFARI
jgi:hypothetical protein